MGESEQLKIRELNHTEILQTIVKGVSPETYVEVGLGGGATINQIQPFVTRAIGIDVRDCKSCLNEGIEFYHMSSDNFYNKYKGTMELDFVFIDGSHDYAQVLRDFLNYSSMTKDQGIIAMHDTHPRKDKTGSHQCGMCWKVAELIRNKYRDEFEIFTVPQHEGLSLIRKTNRQLIWGK